MTRAILFLPIICSLFAGCNADDPTTLMEEDGRLNLTAPNGQKIARDIDDLTQKVGQAAEATFREYKDIQISQITYYEVSEGFMAEVQYETADGYSSNAIPTNIPPTRGKPFKRIIKRAETPGGTSSGETIYTCRSTNRNGCPDCAVVKKSTGPVTCYCSSGQKKYCELIITNY